MIKCLSKSDQIQEKENQVNRRRFLGSVGLIGAIAGLSPFKVFAQPEGAKEAVGSMKCKPYLQAAQQETITIRWITDAPCYSWVEYGDDPDKLNMKAYQVEEGMIQADNTIHAITLTDLSPGKTYYYRAVSRKTENLNRKQQSFGKPVYSQVFKFTTLARDIKSVSFTVFNDIHDRPESFATLMKHQTPGKKDFVFLNGDMFNKQDNEDQIINNLLHPLTNLFASTTPFLFARGNHETWGGYARNLGNYFDGRENKYYYSFEYGPMYGIVMDSGETKPDEDPVNGGVIDFDAYREKQAIWLAKEVQKEAFKKARYRIVFIHIPPYYLDEDAHAANHYKKIWGPIFNSSKIDLMLCGHTHKPGIHAPVKGLHEYPIVIGGGPKDNQRTIININVTDKALNLSMIRVNGETVGTLNI